MRRTRISAESRTLTATEPHSFSQCPTYSGQAGFRRSLTSWAWEVEATYCKELPDLGATGPHAQQRRPPDHTHSHTQYTGDRAILDCQPGPVDLALYLRYLPGTHPHTHTRSWEPTRNHHDASIEPPHYHYHHEQTLHCIIFPPPPPSQQHHHHQHQHQHPQHSHEQATATLRIEHSTAGLIESAHRHSIVSSAPIDRYPVKTNHGVGYHLATRCLGSLVPTCTSR